MSKHHFKLRMFWVESFETDYLNNISHCFYFHMQIDELSLTRPILTI